MRVARQVGEHGGGACERALGVDDPFALTQRREPLSKARGIGQLGVIAEELQLATAMRVLQLFEEAPPEQAREHADWQKEPRLARHPAIGIARQPAARHDAVHMRMMRQCRSLRCAGPG